MSELRQQAINVQPLPPPEASVFDLYGSLVEPDRLFYPLSSEQDHELFALLASWKSTQHIAVVDGAYDVPHDGHAWYLRGCREMAAKIFFGRDYESLDREAKQKMVASNLIKLIVTLDADHKVAMGKGNSPTKGNINRPVYPWTARANRVGGYMIPDGKGGYRPIVDLITVEGDPAHRGGILESHTVFCTSLHNLNILDTWFVYGEHDSVAQIAKNIAGDKVKVISEEEMSVADPRTGEKWSSSSIIERIKKG